MTLKQGQGHQNWYESVDPQQVYDHAKFERPPLNSVCEKAKMYFSSNHTMCKLSPLNMCKRKKKRGILMIWLMSFTTPHSFSLIR